MKQKNFKQLHNRWLCWLGVCFLANLLLTHIAFPIGYLFSPAPIGYIDFMQHYSKAAAFTTMVREHGVMWGYNPFYMAGTPEISDYDLDNKFVEIMTLGLSYLKVSTIHSFKLIIFGEWLLGPFLVLMGFRNFGFSRRKSFWACLAAMMILNGPVGLFFNLGGMFSFVFATLFSFFTVSLFYRVFVNGADRKKILIIAATALAPLLHSTSVFMVGIPAAIIILLKAGNLTQKNWLLLGAAAGAAILLNLFWIFPFLKNFKFTDFNDVAWTGRPDLLTGAMQWLSAILLTMGGLFALLYLYAGLKVLYRQSRRELAIMAACVLAFIVLARWPAWLITRSIQPNRFALTFLLYLLIPAIAYLGQVGQVGPVRQVGFARGLLLISLVIPAGIMGMVRFGNPVTSPALMTAKVLFGRTLGPGRLVEPETREFIRWLNTHTSQQQGRIMIEHPQGDGMESPFVVFYNGLITGIANYVDGQFLGAPRFEPPLLHNQLTRIDHCSMFDIPLKELTREKLVKRLELYNVKWIVAVKGTMTSFLDGFPELFQPVKTIDIVTIYEVLQETGYFLRGNGKVRVSLNQIHLSELEGDDIIIKYHWANDFQTYPPTAIEPFYPREDAVGFIRLIRPPKQVILCFRGAGLEKCLAAGDIKQ